MKKMTEDENYSSSERLLSPEELAECVTRQKEFSLPTIGAKVRNVYELLFCEKSRRVFL